MRILESNGSGEDRVAALQLSFHLELGEGDHSTKLHRHDPVKTSWLFFHQ